MSLSQNTTSLRALLEMANALPSKVDTSGTATAADIYTGKTATVNDAKLTGTNPYNAANVDPAVSSAMAALVEKGVDTSGKGLADLASLIAAIEAGGGGGDLHKATTVTYTPAQNETGFTVMHNLGVVPKAVVMTTNKNVSNAHKCVIALRHVVDGVARMTILSTRPQSDTSDFYMDYADVSLSESPSASYPAWTETSVKLNYVAPGLQLRLTAGTTHTFGIFI